MQVVAVQVREQDEIDAGAVGGAGHGAEPAQRPDPAGEQRVGQHDGAGELQPDGGVAEEPHLEAVHGPTLFQARPRAFDAAITVLMP